MQIVDPHHHLWDLTANVYPWLTTHITPRVCGEYAAIRKNYLIADFCRDIGSLDVVASVHVQAEHDPGDPVRETRWLQAVADDTTASAGFPHGIVAYADLSRADLAATLEAHCRFANTRGIRQSVNGVIDHPGHGKDLLADARWRRNLGLLREFGLSFDLQIYPQQVAAMVPLLDANPGVQFILCHTGLPADRSADGIGRWQAAMQALAARPNVAVKISGFGMFDRRWTVDGIRPLVRQTIALFGTDRCMFASNFPVDGMASDYRRVWDAFATLTADFPPAERDAMVRANALRIYRLDAARSVG